MPASPKLVVIAGAGLSGLTAAYYLNREGIPVRVLEAAAGPGGLIRSQHEQGFLTESGPNTFPGTATGILALCAALGLQPQAADSAAKKRYLYLDGRLCSVPMSPWQFITSPILPAISKWRLLAEPFRPKYSSSDSVTADPSIADFMKHRLDAAFVNRILDPLISGIYAGDVETLSMAAVFPKLWQWERTAGSLLRGGLQAAFQSARQGRFQSSQPRAGVTHRRQLFSFPTGMQTLVQALAAALPKDSIRYQCKVEAIVPLVSEHINSNPAEGPQQQFELRLSSGEKLQADALILATPAAITAPLIQSFCPTAAQSLRGIPYHPLAVVHTAFPKQAIPRSLDGFGFLVPRQERLALLGSIWSSALFPERAPADAILFSNYIGGAHHPQIAEEDPERIVQQVLADLTAVFREALVPVYSSIAMHRQAIPQYTVGYSGGHLARVQTVRQALADWPRLALCGNYLDGIALDACVLSGQRAAERILQASH